MFFSQLLFVIIVTYFGCFQVNSSIVQEQDDKFNPAFRRNKRSADDLAQLPSTQNNPGSPFLMNANMQASYFLGQCVMCPPGPPGPRGATGFQGLPGRDGRDQIIIGRLGDHDTFPNSRETQTPPPTEETSQSDGAGVTYIRWGRTSCPITSQLIYQGVMAGSDSHNGSGANYLCLPLQPTFASNPNYNGGAIMYGVEYNNPLFTSQSIFNSEAPCAVCLANTKQTVIMIPGTNSCLGTQDWTLEYQGYVMASVYYHFKSEFVCVDQNAEGIPGTSSNNDEASLFVADAKCSSGGGGLPCPPYVTGHDILCAVCTL